MDIIQKKKQDFITYCLNKDNRIPSLPKVKQNNRLEAVLIEFRVLPHLSFLLKNAIYKLGSDWSFTIICGNINYDLFMNIKKQIDRDIKIIKKDINNLNREEYSIMLLDSNFYKMFSGEKILIYQEDSIILSKLPNHFLKYDYIGAPFTNKEVGNGGLSLRTKDIMIQICEKYFDHLKNKLKRNSDLLKKYKPKILKKYGKRYFDNEHLKFFYLIEEQLLEDLQITNRMRTYNIGKIPSFDVATLFSIEKYYNEKAFGGHQFWYCVNNVEKWLNIKLKY